MSKSRLITALCLLLLSSVFCLAQQKTLISDTLFQADGSRASGSATITWPAFTSPDNFPIAQGLLTINIANGSVSVQLAPTLGATPAGTSYTVSYFLANSVSYTEYWTVPTTGPVTLTQVRTTPVPVPTTTFGEHQLTLGNGLQTQLGLWRRSTSPVATAEGQCYWDLTSHAVKCTDQTLSFNALGGSDPSRVSKAGDTLTGSLLAGTTAVALGSSANPFGAVFQSAAGSKNSSTFSVNSQGMSLNGVNGQVGNDPNEQKFVSWLFSADGSTSNPNFSNQTGLALQLTSTNGQNDNDQTAKKTFSGINNRGVHFGAGQRFTTTNALSCYGMGDCFDSSDAVIQYGGLNASGDEGTGYRSMNLSQGTYLSLGTVLSNSPQTTCSTTLTQNVTSNLNSQQVTVSSTTGCNVNDWVVIDRGTIDTNDFKEEAVKITAVSGGVITAKFAKNHTSGGLVTPATKLLLNSVAFMGQLRHLVNLSQPAYLTGTVNSISGRVFNGTSTNWSANMVGGDSVLPGCISLAADDYTSYPFSPSYVLKAWYPITAASTNAITIVRRDAVGTVVYAGNGPGNGSYAVRPCARILAFENNGDSVGNLVILETNTFPWAVGDTLEAVQSVNGEVSGEIMRVGWFMPGASLRSVYTAVNEGAQTFSSAFRAAAQMTVANQTAYSVGMLLDAQMGRGVDISGTTTTGIGISLRTGAGDSKAIRWYGGTDNAIYSDPISADFVLARSFSSPSQAPKVPLSLATNSTLVQGSLVVTSAVQNKIRLETLAAGTTSYEFRSVANSAIEPTNSGMDLFVDSLNRPLVSVNSYGQLGMNSSAPATLASNTPSFHFSHVFETFNGVSSDLRYIHTRAVPDSGIYPSGGTVPAEWQLLGTGTLNGGQRPVFAGFKNTGILRFGDPNKGLVSLDASTVTAARNLTLPNASGTVALTTTPGTSGASPNWTATSGLNIPLASSGSVTAGLLGNADYLVFSAKENALLFALPLSRSGNTISCPTCEVTSNKNIASGYAGLTSSGKLLTSQGQKVWSATDLTTYASTSGSGTTALQSTISSPVAGQVLTYNGSDWVNQTMAGAGLHNLLSASHPDTTTASVVRGDLISGQGSSATWQRLALGAIGLYLRSNGTDLAYSSVAAAGAGSCAANQWVTGANDNAAPTCAQPGFSNLSGSATSGQLPSSVVYNNQSNTYTSGLQDFSAATAVLPKSSDPASPGTGQVWVNSGALKYRDNSGSPATQVVEVQSNRNAANGYAGLTAASVLAAGQFPALTGDVTTTAGSLTTTLPNIATAGTNTKITYNAKGQVTAGAAAAASDLSNGTTGSGSVVLAGSPTVTDLTANQNANGDDTLAGKRKTDTSPTGNLVHFQNAAGNTDLWTVDVTGTLQAGTVPGARVSGNIAGNAATATALAATPSQCGSNNFATGVAASGNANCSQPSASNLSNGTTGSGSVVLATSPAITTPTISGALGGNLDLGSSALVTEVANDTTTGTGANQLAKLTGATSAAIKAATTDTSGIVGIVVAGNGASGNAQLARAGRASCAFDNSTVAGDYVQISSSVAGDCHDTGSSTLPASGQIIGIVLTTNGSAGTYPVQVFSPGIQASPRVIPAGMNSASTLGSGQTNYLFGVGNSSLNSSQATRQIPVPAGGTVSTFYCATQSAQSAGGSLVLTMQKNGSDTTLLVTVPTSAAAGTFSDTTHSFTVTPGDLLDIKVVNNGSGTSASMLGCSYLLQ